MIVSRVDGAVSTITIDDPDRRNPLSNEAMEQLGAAVRTAGLDETVRVIVITGAGDRAFSAGGDLSGGFVDSPLGDHEQRGALADVLRTMRLTPKPIIGRVNGVALGGGFGIAVACDITIVVDDARMGTPEIDVGLWPMMISAVLASAMPHKALLAMMLTGDVFDAETALAYGLVTRVVARDTLDAAIAETTEALLRRSPAALALGKRSFYAMSDMDVDTALDLLHLGLTATAATEDGAEGVAAFLGKRPPVWKGR